MGRFIIVMNGRPTEGLRMERVALLETQVTGGAVMASPQHQIIIFRDMYDEGQRNERSDCGGFIETSGKWSFIGTSEFS